MQTPVAAEDTEATESEIEHPASVDPAVSQAPLDKSG